VPTPRATAQYALLILLLLLRLDIVELSASCWCLILCYHASCVGSTVCAIFHTHSHLFAVAVSMRCGRGILDEPSRYL
jgi:hypothetical protein